VQLFCKNKERRNEKKTLALVTYPTSSSRKNNIDTFINGEKYLEKGQEYKIININTTTKICDKKN
jgi:hypothetical protein